GPGRGAALAGDARHRRAVGGRAGGDAVVEGGPAGGAVGGADDRGGRGDAPAGVDDTGDHAPARQRHGARERGGAARGDRPAAAHYAQPGGRGRGGAAGGGATDARAVGWQDGGRRAVRRQPRPAATGPTPRV